MNIHEDTVQLQDGSLAIAGVKVKKGIFFIPLISRNSCLFSVSSAKGAFQGKFRVEITAGRKTGRQEKYPFGNLFDVREQYLPEQYNPQSELTAKVTSLGPNQFEFDLRSE